MFLASTCYIQYIRTYVCEHIAHMKYIHTYVRTYVPESMREPGPTFKSFQENMKSPQLRTNQKYCSLCNQLQSTMYICMHVPTHTLAHTYHTLRILLILKTALNLSLGMAYKMSVGSIAMTSI